MPITDDKLAALAALGARLWLASWTIHNANHFAREFDGLKVAATGLLGLARHHHERAFISTCCGRLDRVAVKAGMASPIFHAIQLCSASRPASGWKISAATKARRAIPRAPGRDDVDFLHRSVGLGRGRDFCSLADAGFTCARMAGGSRGRRAHGRAWSATPSSTRANIFEALLEGWKQGLRNCWWIIDYNGRSLDAVVREGLWERYEQLFKNFRLGRW